MIDNYIPRYLLERDKYYQAGENLFLFDSKTINLKSLLLEGKKRIVLLGDAGYGKSTELKKLAEEFINEKNQDFIPILIELNTYVNEEIKDIICIKIGEDSLSLLEHNRANLVFLFDEFDQVLDKEKATRKIKNFVEIYSESTFVISCRTNFYSGQFEEFNNFVILPFTYEQISAYAVAILKDRANIFIESLSNSPLIEVAKNPFALDQLIRIFEKDGNIPDKHSYIISRMISIFLENDADRLNKYELKQRYPVAEIRKDLAYKSLVMETLQKNYVSIEEFNKILQDNFKSQVIAELSLIKKAFPKDGYVIQFLHNNFQEYLGAEVLYDKKLDTILNFISYRTENERRWINTILSKIDYLDINLFGLKLGKILSDVLKLVKFKNINKINPSWVNTVAFLCLLREEDDLLDYLMTHEPELTLKFETSRVSEPKKEKIFKTIFEKYTTKGIPIDRDIDYKELANFARTAGSKAKAIFDYLMEYAYSDNHYNKYNSISMLMFMKGFDDRTLRDLLIRHIKNDNEEKSIRHLCFYALAELKMTSVDIINEILYLKDTNDDWILSGLYYLIKESEYTDEFVDVLLAGLPNSRIYMNSTETRLGDESWNLEQGLVKIKSPHGVKKITKYFLDNAEDLHEYHITKSIDTLVNNFVDAYTKDSSIYDDVKELLKAAQKKYYSDSRVDSLVEFFKKTGTVFRLFTDLYKEDMEDNCILLALIADKQCIDFLIGEHNAKKLSEDSMWCFVRSLSFSKDKHKSLLDIINKKTGKFYLPPAQDYKKEQKEKLDREIEIIFDKTEFMKEVENIFRHAGKNELAFEDINNILRESYRESKFNNFVVREIKNYVFSKDTNKKWTIEKIKDEIDQWNYEWFTIVHIFNLMNNGAEIEINGNQEDIIRAFCLKNLSVVDFKNTLRVKDDKDTTTANQLAVFLWYFSRSLGIDYPETVFLDMLSFDWVERIGFVGIDYLEDRLDQEKIKRRILENLQQGIKVDQALRNHINYCKKHQIQEAKEYLYKIITDDKINIDTRLLALDVISIYSESEAFIESLLDAKEFKLFSKSAEILSSKNDRTFESKLVGKLSSKDDNIALESAKFLIKLQNLRAIKFYASYIKKTKKFTSGIRAASPLSSIKTLKALPVLFGLLKFYFEYKKEIQQDDFFRLDSAIIGALKNIARQDYSNYLKVRKKLQKFVNDNKHYENINYLNYVYNDIEKDFFVNYKRQISIDEAIAQVKGIL